MAIKVKITVKNNAITNEKVASAQIVDMQTMGFTDFCEYLADGCTIGEADVAAVMVQLEKKLPLLLSMGVKVQISQDGMMVKPTVSGSLSQSALKAKLQAKKDAGDEAVDVDREVTATDLTVSMLTAGVDISFSKRFKSAFALNATLERKQNGTASGADEADTSGKDTGKDEADTSDKGGTSSGGDASSGDGEY